MTKQPTISLQEHLEKLAAERERMNDRLDAERDLRYQQRFQAQNEAVSAAMAAAEKAIAAALIAAEKAVGKAEVATEKRFDAVNEFRQSLNDIAALQVGRAEYQAGHANLAEKIDSLAKSIDTGAGRSAGTSATWATIAVGAGIVLTLAGLAVAIVSRLV